MNDNPRLLDDLLRLLLVGLDVHDRRLRLRLGYGNRIGIAAHESVPQPAAVVRSGRGRQVLGE